LCDRHHVRNGWSARLITWPVSTNHVRISRSAGSAQLSRFNISIINIYYFSVFTAKGSFLFHLLDYCYDLILSCLFRHIICHWMYFFTVVVILLLIASFCRVFYLLLSHLLFVFNCQFKYLYKLRAESRRTVSVSSQVSISHYLVWLSAEHC